MMQYIVISVLAVAIGGWMLYPLIKSRFVNTQAPNQQEDLPDGSQPGKRKRKKAKSSPKGRIVREEQTANPQTDDPVKIEHEFERLHQVDDIEAAIEAEVLQLRTHYASQRKSDSHKQPAIRINFCPQCGIKISSNRKFCQQCGLNLSQFIREELI